MKEEYINSIAVELETGEREDTVSNCCGAGHHDENMICEDCGEHCGAEQVEEIPGFEGTKAALNNL